jgi:glycosyltransferase involved in cell wall biosynthesis
MAEARMKLHIPQHVKVVGSVGRLDTPKDYWTLVDAAALVLKKESNVMFVVIGGGPQEAFLLNLVDQNGLSDRFYLTGWRTDARELIAAFDLSVSTSMHEAFGNTLVEAALLRKAVIASSIDGIPEAVINNETGVLLTPTCPFRELSVEGASQVPRKVVIHGKLQSPRSLSPQELAEKIVELLNLPDQLEEMGERGRERAEKQFSIKKYVTDLEMVYMDILDANLKRNEQ